MIKKLLSITTVLMMGLCLFCGCNEIDEGFKEPEIEDKPFYTLTEAYNYGWLTQEDLKSIAYYHNGGRAHNEEIMSDTYEPMPKTPEVLNEETTLAINEAYYDMHASQSYDHTIISIEDVGFIYYGTYHDCVVIKIGYKGMAVSEAVREEKIGGVTVFYPELWFLSVWRQKEVCT